mmetsp:Transcript_38411/g.98222  ORF Transcript_38411/g.98222 Transcript_38411/m.98222 type:complete len:261 (+) Transcript_38411:1323-2105(+)
MSTSCTAMSSSTSANDPTPASVAASTAYCRPSIVHMWMVPLRRRELPAPYHHMMQTSTIRKGTDTAVLAARHPAEIAHHRPAAGSPPSRPHCAQLAMHTKPQKSNSQATYAYSWASATARAYLRHLKDITARRAFCWNTEISSAPAEARRSSGLIKPASPRLHACLSVTTNASMVCCDSQPWSICLRGPTGWRSRLMSWPCREKLPRTSSCSRHSFCQSAPRPLLSAAPSSSSMPAVRKMPLYSWKRSATLDVTCSSPSF